MDLDCLALGQRLRDSYSFGGFAAGRLGSEENFCKMHVEQGA